MTIGFRGRQIAALTLTAISVALATGLINAVILVRVQVLEAQDRADLLARTLYHLASGTIRRLEPDGVRAGLAADPALRQYAEAVIGYSPIALYVAIKDQDGVAILHSDPRQEGRPLGRFETFAEFSKRNALSQLWAFGRDQRVLVADLPFSADGVKPFGSVVVAVSTLLVKRQLIGVATTHALIAGVVVLLAFLTSFFVANRLLAPVARLRRELARINPGEGRPPLELETEADVGRLIEFFAAASERLSSGREERDGPAWPKTMLDGLVDAVIVFSGERRVLSLNDDACRLLGKSRDELEAQAVEDVLPQGHPLRALVLETLAGHEAVRSRTVTLSVRGRRVPYLLTAHALRELDRVSGVMVTARDLQQFSRLGSQLSYSQKLAALGRLTSGVAHEIKNPLNALVLHVELLRQRLGDTDQDVGRHLDVLDEEVRRLDRVVQGFLKFTRPEDLQLEVVRLGEIVREVLEFLTGEAEQRGIGLEGHVAAELPTVQGSAELLRQVLLNLAGNAFDAMSGGGVLRVRAEAAPEGSVALSVEDTGQGISAEDLPKVFDLFYTTKAHGNGVGLSMVYRIVQLHGGEIHVDSERGVGTRVTMSFPEAVL